MDQCVQGEGIVQVNVQVQFLTKKINIVDVLKPAKDYIHNGNHTLKSETTVSHTSFLKKIT